jgi:type II secretory pathway component PulF
MTDQFRYRASTLEGQLVEGVVQAPSRKLALEELGRQQLYPVDLAPVTEASRGATRRTLGRSAALALFARTVATMLAAGVGLDRAIVFAAGQARHPEVAEAGRDVHQRLRSGSSLADALAGHAVFGPLFVAMVAAGEESGALDETLERLADNLDEQVELNAQIRASLLYPALMAFASTVGTAILLLFVVPRFASMIVEGGATLPLSTRILLGISWVVVHAWWLLLLAGGLLALGARAWLARPENRLRLHSWRLAWPMVGDLELKYATARFSQALGMLLRSGRPVLASLRTARSTVSNLSMRVALDRAADAVSHGKRVHVAMAGTLPALAAELIAVGEESGRLDELCLRIAQTYDTEVRRSLRSLVAVIEPALILLFGLIVGFVALAMLQAIYGVDVSRL